MFPVSDFNFVVAGIATFAATVGYACSRRLSINLLVEFFYYVLRAFLMAFGLVWISQIHQCLQLQRTLLRKKRKWRLGYKIKNVIQQGRWFRTLRMDRAKAGGIPSSARCLTMTSTNRVLLISSVPITLSCSTSCSRISGIRT